MLKKRNQLTIIDRLYCRFSSRLIISKLSHSAVSGLLRDTAAAQSRQSRVHCSGRSGEREGLSRAAGARDTGPGDSRNDRALAATQWGLRLAVLSC